MSDLHALRAAVAASPENVPLLLLFGQACLEDWAVKEGREVFERVLALTPAEPAAKLGVAKALFQMNEIDEAVVRTEALVGEAPDFAPGWVLLCRLCLSEGKAADARDHYERARELDGSIADGAVERELYGDTPAANDDRQRGRLVNRSTGWDEPDLPDGLGDDPDAEGRDVERPAITFDDVGGMDAVKEEIRMKILYPLQKPELFRAYGKSIGGGVLLYGPPGCGKTLLSRATAGEIQANFLAVGIHDILDMYVGNSEKNLHELFELARSHAPTVLFFDEIDALAADRRDMRHSAGRTTINQFLAELDGHDSHNEGLLILGATNAPWHLDPAFRRPGRFDRVLFVPPPDAAAREDIVRIMARNKPVADLDAATIAKKTKNFSGADLMAVFDITIERTLAAAMKAGRVVPITTRDLLKTAKQVTPSSKAWFESAKNYALYANQTGFYDDVLAFLGITKS